MKCIVCGDDACCSRSLIKGAVLSTKTIKTVYVCKRHMNTDVEW
jgi:hypothetical protein